MTVRTEINRRQHYILPLTPSLPLAPPSPPAHPPSPSLPPSRSHTESLPLSRSLTESLCPPSVPFTHRVHLEVDHLAASKSNHHLPLVHGALDDRLLAGRLPLVDALVGADVTNAIRVDLGGQDGDVKQGATAADEVTACIYSRKTTGRPLSAQCEKERITMMVENKIYNIAPALNISCLDKSIKCK